MYLKKNLWNVIICIDSQTKPSSKAKFLLLLLFIMFIIYIIYLLIFFYYLFGIQLGATVNHTWNMFTASASSAWTPLLRFSLLINVITYGALTFLKVLVLRIQKKKHAEHFCLINEPPNIIIEKQLNKHGKYICFSTCL